MLNTVCTATQTFIVKTLGLQLPVARKFLNLVRTLELWNIVQPIQVFAAIMARVSVAILLLRIVGFKVWQRYLLYACIGSTIISGLLIAITTLPECKLIIHGPEERFNYCVYRDYWVYIAIAVSGASTFITSFGPLY